jgi:hypothetical protein
MKAVLSIEIIKTPLGFMVVYDDDYLEDKNGDNTWDTFYEAMCQLENKMLS